MCNGAEIFLNGKDPRNPVQNPRECIDLCSKRRRSGCHRPQNLHQILVHKL